MPWAAIARVLEITRWPLSSAAAFACSVALMRGPFRELPQALPIVFVVVFVIALLFAVFVMTALLAFAEHAADDAQRKRKRKIDLPTAIATYRTEAHEMAPDQPAAPPSPLPASGASPDAAAPSRPST